MPIDPRIAMGFQPTTQLESPLNRLAKFQQLESGQRANELAKMQMQEYQRGLQEQEGLRNYLAGSPDLASPKVQSELMRYGKPGVDFAETMAKRASEQAKLRETQAKTESSQFDLSRKRLAAGYQAVSTAKSGADVIAALDDGVKQGYFSQEQADAQKAEVAALQTMPEFQKWQQNKLQQFVSAEKQLEMSAPKPREVKRADGSIIFLDENPNSLTFKQEVLPSQAPGMTPAESQRLANERARLGYEGERIALEGRRVRVAEQQQTQKSAVKPLTEAQQIKARETIAKDRQVVSAIDASEKTMTSEIERLLKHPGLKGITGYTGMIPSLPASEAGAAENILEGIKGKVKTLGRDLASQSGKLGNMAVQEWKFVSDAVAALDPRSKDFPNQLKLVQEAMKGLKDRSRAKFEETYPDLAADNAPAKPTSPLPQKPVGGVKFLGFE